MRYVLHQHDTVRNNPHQDLRFELENGTVRSFAIPKGLPKEMGLNRLAIEGKPHTLECLTFEGEIEKGYGKGTLKILTSGEYLDADGLFEFELEGLGTFKLFPFKDNHLIRKVK